LAKSEIGSVCPQFLLSRALLPQAAIDPYSVHHLVGHGVK